MLDDEAVWEKSVAMAFRDCQWLYRTGPFIPKSTIALDSKFERAGDVLMPLGDRYFVFELKGGLEKIKSEWKSKEVDGEQQAAKAAYRELDALMTLYLKAPKAQDLIHVNHAMRGHFFAFWKPFKANNDQQLGTIEVLSYLQATAELKPWREAANVLRQRYCFCIPGGRQQAGEDGEYDRIGSFYLPNVLLDHVALLERSATSLPRAYQLGLNSKELHEYVALLLASVDQYDPSINVMITNADGSFCRRVTKLSELRNIFNPSDGPGLHLGAPALQLLGEKMRVGRRRHPHPRP